MSSTGSIKGVVRNARSTPLPNANVMIVWGPSHPDVVATTDDEGVFLLGGLRPGNYTLKVHGARTRSADLVVRVLAGKTAMLEVWLDEGASGADRYGSIRGTIRNEAGVPLQDVSVMMVEGPSVQDLSALTGADGTFGFWELPPGLYGVQAYSEAGQSAVLSVRVLEGKTAVLDVVLQAVVVDEWTT